jgi:UDP-N-acetylglucosamine--N-acetylmuramyl-(pentapeptide) pyrophosphoryl-undecaprenol N-acetylglucosamine transferase
MRPRRVIISGGGTGGHLFPALVLGRKLRERDPQLELTYVGSGRDVERRIMAEHGVPTVALRIEGLKGRGWRSLGALALLPFAFLKSLAVLVRLRPRLVVGVGGFSSGPIVLLAAWLRFPTVILEQNVRPGFTNRILVRWVRAAAAAFDATLPALHGKGLRLGNPVREEFYRVKPKRREGPFALLVFGGSQGSRFLNERVPAALALLQGRRPDLTVVHQTGERELRDVRRRYDEAGFAAAEVAAFLPDMADRVAAADLVVCRAGATTIAELIAARRAAILVPFAGAADDHQTANARELARAGGAEVIPEAEATAGRLADRIGHFLAHRNELDIMERALAPLATPDAADRIADLCRGLIERRFEGGPS